MSDLEMIQEWQSSLEGNSWLAVRDLDLAVEKLESLLRSRQGIQFLRTENRNISSLQMRLLNIVTELSTREFLEAAE